MCIIYDVCVCFICIHMRQIECHAECQIKYDKMPHRMPKHAKAYARQNVKIYARYYAGKNAK